VLCYAVMLVHLKSKMLVFFLFYRV